MKFGKLNISFGGLMQLFAGGGKMLIFCILPFIVACNDVDEDYVLDPEDAPSNAPLVSVLYDPGALGDRAYNDLIYRGVEDAAKEHGLRTLQISPTSVQEGMVSLQTIFDQMSTPQDTVRRLFIVAGASYEGFVRENCNLLALNPYADLLYLETSTPLQGKGSTLYLSYYGAMYEAGAIAPIVAPEVLLVAANSAIGTVTKALEGFAAGFQTEIVPADAEKLLLTCYISDQPNEGFSIADTTALNIMYKQEWQGGLRLLVPICGGAAGTFYRMCDLMDGFEYMGIDSPVISPNCPFSVVKHIDRAVALCIEQWLSQEGMSKHQSFSLADGYTEVVVHPYTYGQKWYWEDMVTEEIRKTIHAEAIKMEAEYEK